MITLNDLANIFHFTDSAYFLITSGNGDYRYLLPVYHQDSEFIKVFGEYEVVEIESFEEDVIFVLSISSTHPLWEENVKKIFHDDSEYED